jgi:MFS superfamily sulfate permease-like transporter
VDTTASDVLLELDHALDERGQTLVFAELKDRVLRKIERYGLTDAIEPRHFFPTVETAVEAFRAETGAVWTDATAPPPAPRVSPEEHLPKSPA